MAKEVTTGKIKQRKGIRQRDAIPPNILSWEQRGMKIDGQYLNHLGFTDNIVLISNNIDELLRSIDELKREYEEVGLKMNNIK